VIRVVHDAEGNQDCAEDQPCEAERKEPYARAHEYEGSPGAQDEAERDDGLRVEPLPSESAHARRREVLLDIAPCLANELTTAVERRLERRSDVHAVRLTEPVDDAAAVEVVRRHLDADAVSEHHPDAVPLHPTSRVADHLVPVLEADPEHPVAEGLDDLALHLDLLFLLSDDASLR